MDRSCPSVGFPRRAILVPLILALILFTLNVTAEALGSDCLLRDIQASKGYNAPSVAQNQRRSVDKDDSASDDSDDDAGYATSITTIVFSPTISQISGGQPTVTVSAFVPVAANSGMQGFVNALPPMPMAPSGRPMLPFAPMVPGNPAVQPFVPMVAGTPTVGMSAAPSMQGMMAAPSMSQMPGGPMGPMVPMGSMGTGGAATYFPVQNVNLILQSSFASTSSVSGCPHSCDCSSSSSSSHGCDCCCGAMNPPSPVCSHGGNDWCCCGSPPPVSSPSCFCCCSMSSSTPSPVCPPCCCWCPMNTSSSTSSSSPVPSCWCCCSMSPSSSPVPSCWCCCSMSSSSPSPVSTHSCWCCCSNAVSTSSSSMGSHSCCCCCCPMSTSSSSSVSSHGCECCCCCCCGTPSMTTNATAPPCHCCPTTNVPTPGGHCCGGGQPPANGGPGDCCRWIHDFDDCCCPHSCAPPPMATHEAPAPSVNPGPLVTAAPFAPAPGAVAATGVRRPEQPAASSSSGKTWQAPQAARPTPDWVPSANDINEFTRRPSRVVGGGQGLPTLHNRPEVGETTAAQTEASASSVSENFRIHNGGQDAGFTESVNEWERLLVATKTVGLPELLDRPHGSPVFEALPTETNSMHFDPSNPLTIDSYQAPEYNRLAVGDRPDKIAEDVWRLVESLSLEEKAGQMQQIHVSQLLDRSGHLNASAVEYWISKKMVGSVVDSPGNGQGEYAWYSAATLANLTNSVQQVALAQGSRVPVLWGLDSVRGANFVKHAAMFPAGIGIAATFQPKHAYEAGRIAARDTRAAGYQWAFAPSADLNVEKRWAHNYLGFGEDPLLLSSMVRGSVGGYQGEYRGDRARVAACVKNFIGSGVPFNGKERSAKFIPDNLLYEYYLPGFEAAIAAGASSIMQSGGNVNGEAMSLSGYYLRRLLRDKLGFRGVMIADHDEILAQAREFHTAANFTDAVFLALNNTSVDMSAGDSTFSANTIELVNAGSVGEDRVTESVARIIQLKKDLGLFDAPFSERQLQETVGSAQDVNAARMAVSESLTLLKNDNGALPLKPNERVLFVGPHLNSTALLGGGWNVHRQGPTASERDDVYEGFGDSVLAGIRKLTNREPVYHPGFRLDGRPSDSAALTNLIRLARQADKIVVGLGETPYAGHMGDINELSLDANQAYVVSQLALVNRPIITVLIEGRPRLLKDVATVSSAVLNAYLPGIHGGLPIAEVLYGKVSPSGRQPFTYPRYEYQSRDTIWQGLYNEYTPQWPFGYGLGYSPLVYSNITVDSNELRPGQPVKVSVSIRNDGQLDQKESVLLYTTQGFRTGYEPELYRLRGFDKVEIGKGMATVVEFTVTAEELAYYNRDLVRVIDPSPVNITINAMTPNERVITLNLAL